MKIFFSCFDSIGNSNYSGGGALVIRELAEYFSFNNDVTIISGSYPGCRENIKNKVTQKYIGLSFLGPKINQFVYQILLPFCALSMKFDIWLEGFTPPYSAAFLPLFTKNPVVGVTHFLNAEEKSKEYHLPFTWLQRIGIKQYKNIIALTQTQKEKIKKINESCDVQVIPNGTYLPLTKSVTKKLGKYVLFLGRFEVFQKGLDLLIPAFVDVNKKTNAFLYLAGSGQPSDVEKINTLIKRNNLQNKVKIIGRVEGKRKEVLLRKAQCLVMPSRFEGQSLTAIEAIVSGTPIVCFDIDGLQWVNKNISLKAKVFNIEELSANLIKIITSTKLRTQLSKQCIAIARNYSWQSVKDKYTSYIESVAQ